MKTIINRGQGTPMEQAIQLVRHNHLTIAMASKMAGVSDHDLLNSLIEVNDQSSDEIVMRPQVMHVSISEKRFKKGLMSLKNQMRKKGFDVKHSDLLEAAATFFGFKNWATMKAVAFVPLDTDRECYYEVTFEESDAKGGCHETT